MKKRVRMQISALKLSMFVFIAVTNLLEGSEEFFIAPTAWHYIHFMGQTKEFLGFVQASYCLGIIFSGPITGALADKCGRIKLIVGFCFLIKVAGNLLYSIPTSPYNALFGRFLCGVGCGYLGPLHGQVASYTPLHNRGKVFILLDGMYLLGSVVGPAVGSFAIFHVNIFGWKIGPGNSPAVILMLTWTFAIVVFFFLPSEFVDEDKADGAIPIEMDDDNVLKQDARKGSRKTAIFCIFFLIFLNMYYVSTAVFYTPLLAQIHYHLNLLFVKLLFLTAALFSVILFLLLFIFSKNVDERNLFLSTHSLHLIAILFLTYISLSWLNTSVYQVYFLLCYLIFGMQCYAFALGCSLVSQITDPSDAAFYQGASFSSLSFGFLVSRVAAGFIFGQAPIFYYCLALCLSWVVGTLWFCFEYKNLKS